MTLTLAALALSTLALLAALTTLTVDRAHARRIDARLAALLARLDAENVVIVTTGPLAPPHAPEPTEGPGAAVTRALAAADAVLDTVAPEGPAPVRAWCGLHGKSAATCCPASRA